MKKPFVLFISGPTASGKTGLAENLAEKISAEIINADVGQFYKPLSIGTAKPDLQNSKIPQHLFDIIDTPKDLTTFEYCDLVLNKINEISCKGKIPIVVGGSLFYIKSLYFPSKKFEKKTDVDAKLTETESLWETLNQIDPDRAKELHPNDEYRIKRALQIWLTTGVKPSTYKPEFNPPFNSLFIFINPEKEILLDRINKRTQIMFDQGWIDEAKKIMGTGWEKFIVYKGLIGYPEIFEWIKNGEKKDQINSLIKSIQIKTRQYAKKQITFWKSFKKQLLIDSKDNQLLVDVFELNDYSNQLIDSIIKKIN